MVNEITITRTKDSVDKIFFFETGEVKNLSQPQVNQKVSLTLGKDESTDTTEDFTVDLGVSQLINFSWKLYKEDNDRSSGTEGGGIATYEEMLNYLEEVIAYPGIGIINYTLVLVSKFRTVTYICSLEDFSINTDSAIYPVGNFSFKIKRKVV